MNPPLVGHYGLVGRYGMVRLGWTLGAAKVLPLHLAPHAAADRASAPSSSGSLLSPVNLAIGASVLVLGAVGVMALKSGGHRHNPRRRRRRARV